MTGLQPFLRNALRFVGVLCLVFSCISDLNAQGTGVILGTITDASNAVLPGAEVQIKNVGTGQAHDILADEQGRYRASALNIGAYEVSAVLAGFSRSVQTGITLTVGATLVVNLQLTVGQQAETVEVKSEVSQVETQSTAMGVLVESRQIRELPLNGRDYTQLIALNPGVTEVARGSTFYGSGQRYSIAGARPSGQNYLLDGTDMTSFFNHAPGSGALGTALGVEAIAEFQTLTNTASAQYGGNSAVINASSRSGTNQFHGSVYEFLRNNALEARDFFDVRRPPYRQNQFGASLGGPIKKDKMFFFGNFEGLRTRKTTTTVLVVPNVQLVGVRDNQDPNSGAYRLPNGQELPEHPNPATRQAIRDTLVLYPAPITPIGTAGTATSLGNQRLEGDQNYILGRYDCVVSEKSSIFFRYVVDRADRDFNGAVPWWPELYKTRSHYATLQERRVLSPMLVNVARLNFMRPNESGRVYGAVVVEKGIPRAVNAGVTENNPFAHIPGRQDAVIAVGSGVAGLGAAPQLPFYMIQNKFGFSEEIIWTSGRHTVLAGATAARHRENTWAPNRAGGNWTFGSLANFLQGRAQTVAGQVSDAQNPEGDAVRDLRYWVFGFYVDDQWNVSPRLTLNLGLRYSPTTRTKVVRHDLYNLIKPPYGLFEKVDYLTGPNPSLRNWDPRVGIAWDPFGDQKTSIRAGFAIFHSPVLSRDNIPWFMPPAVQATQTAAQGLTYPFPFTNVPVGSGLVIPTDGTLTILQTGTNYLLGKTPYQMQWNLNIQREVLPGGIATIGYLGSRGVHLFVLRDFNSPVPFIGPSGRETFGVFDASRNSVIANPRLNPLYNALNLADTAADSSYHGLQTSLSKRFSQRWQSQFSYTWSKSIDNASGSYGLDGGGTTMNPFDLSANRGLSNFHREHNFRASGIYELPFAANGNLGKLVGGWSATGIFRFLTGSPFSPGAAANSTHNSSGSSSGRPDLVAGCKLYPDNQDRLNWFNPDCFIMQPLGAYGNAGRNILIGPNNWNLDFSLLKDTRLTERFSLQFRAEAFNILNHPNFANPASGIFTSLTGARDANAGQITSTASDPRQIQLALKLLF
jgi:Carboxypeptidase regulatory-like domain/TonB dependent receptor-like, beta-barrel/TonB-dependent Receptor Plug Domain